MDATLLPSVASRVNFSEICGLLEKIHKTHGNDKKKRILKEFIDKWREFHSELHGQNKTTDSFYPAMRLLLPHLEKERVAYGIKENTLARLLIEVLCLGKDSSDAMKLLHYKAPKSAKMDAGDFASVAYFVLKNRCPDHGTLTIKDVNDCLDGIAENNAAKKKDQVRKFILQLLKSLSAMEQKWLIRMIMKELKVGLSQASVFSVFHSDAEELYNVNNNIEKVCQLLGDTGVRIYEIGVSLFSPFTPMLGETAAPNKVEKLMNSKSYFIETKYDGERMLLHKEGDDYKYYSRSGNEYTSSFGSTPYDGSLTPHISDSFKPDVACCILDGEMLGYHAASKTFGSKGENFDIKKTDESSLYQPCYHVFDITYYNGKVLTNLPLRERLPYLAKVFTPVDGRILISQHTEAKSNQDCADALNEAIDNREEGIMIKNPESVYRPNTRKGGWFKIKPEYVGGLMDELDVLIVGGYFGTGHRSGMMSHFLCAVAVPNSDGGEPNAFHSFCKVGSGYTKKELQHFNTKMAANWKVFDKKNPPSSIILASGFKEKPDAWIEPSLSSVIQIKAAEIINSERYKTGCTLRFPRVEKFRTDKEWHACLTTIELEDLRQKSGGKLAGSRVDLDAEDGEPTKKKRKVVSRVMRPTLGKQFRGADISNIQKVSKMLEGKEFCVINGSPDFTKQDIEKKIVEYGGAIAQSPANNTLCVLVQKVVTKVNNLIKVGRYDIIKVDWFRRCIDAQMWTPWAPSDMIHTSHETLKKFQMDFDEYGDSFTQDTTVEQLQDVFSRIQEGKINHMNTEEIAEIEEKYFPDDSPYGLFRTCRIYIDNKRRIGDLSSIMKDSKLEILAMEVRFFGAALCDTLSESTSHVLMDRSDLQRLSDLKKIRRERNKKFHIVTEEWIRECLAMGSLCPERHFEPSNPT